MPPRQNQNFGVQQFTPMPSNNIQNLMPFRRVYYKTLRKGALLYCQYTFWHHDPNPLVLVTDVEGDRIRGVNLHYLTFKYVKGLLSKYCGKMHFDYGLISHDPYIVNAFRTYKKSGMRNIQLLDCDIINMQFQEQRKAYKYNPQELKAIRDRLRKQMQGAANMSADDIANQYTQMLGTEQGFQDLPNNLRQDGRRAFQPQPTQPATRPTQPATQPGQQSGQ